MGKNKKKQGKNTKNIEVKYKYILVSVKNFLKKIFSLAFIRKIPKIIFNPGIVIALVSFILMAEYSPVHYDINLLKETSKVFGKNVSFALDEVQFELKKDWFAGWYDSSYILTPQIAYNKADAVFSIDTDNFFIAKVEDLSFTDSLSGLREKENNTFEELKKGKQKIVAAAKNKYPFGFTGSKILYYFDGFALSHAYSENYFINHLAIKGKNNQYSIITFLYKIGYGGLDHMEDNADDFLKFQDLEIYDLDLWEHYFFEKDKNEMLNYKEDAIKSYENAVDFIKQKSI